MYNKHFNKILIITLIIFLIVFFTFLIKLILTTKKEGFNENTGIYTDYGNSDTTHTVNLPLTTTYSCRNMCSSQSKCYITGEQCFSDIDCYGCKPNIKVVENKYIQNVRGQNDAGKYSFLTPQYSSLTTDIGTKAKLYNGKNSRVPNINWGPDLWTKSFNFGEKIDKDNSSYLWDPKPEDYKFVPKYPLRQSLSGLFKDDGPLAGNAYL